MISLVTWGCGASKFVDSIEDDTARVEEPSGVVHTVKLSELPSGVREGDVVVRGRIDANARARAVKQVRDLAQPLRVPMPATLELDGPGPLPLTPEAER